MSDPTINSDEHHLGPLKKQLLEKIKNLPFSRKLLLTNTRFFQNLFPDEIINLWDNSSNNMVNNTEKSTTTDNN